MPCQDRVQILVLWHLTWTRLADYQAIFSLMTEHDIILSRCFCHVLNAVRSHRHWAMPVPHTHICPFTSKVRQSHLPVKLGTNPNLCTLPSGPRDDDSQSYEGVITKKHTNDNLRQQQVIISISSLVSSLSMAPPSGPLFQGSSFWPHISECLSWWHPVGTGLSWDVYWYLKWDVNLFLVKIELKVFWSFQIKVAIKTATR